ncbi:hypothetical protein OSB04_024988 [Centaurea solstitialis]|uniref:Uncharacterized protein n=1 Tax=Centaurea solstitialis TaxID=347529 RepID=A0AA38T0L1_9ASTR|nr:hypothetical protein OSB04_024988 [Centaurea solstitialis]
MGFINASTTAEINQQFLGYTTAKGLWDFLAKRYTSSGLSHQYQLWTTFQNKLQLPDQSVSFYISEIHDETARQFQAYFSQLHLITILMRLTDKFENETRLQLRSPITVDTTLYTPSSAKPRGKFTNNSGKYNNNAKPARRQTASEWKPNTNECTFCHSTSHLLLDCLIRKCRYCRVTHLRRYLFDFPQNPNPNLRSYQHQNQSVAKSVTPSEPFSVAIAGSVSSSPDLMDLMRINQELMEQLMTGSLGVNSQHSSTSGTIWIFDSGCFKHMTPCPDGFLSKQPYQLSSVKNNKSFSFTCLDPKTKQILGVGRRVGWVLEVVYMRLPLQSPKFSASVSSTGSFDLWYARLGSLGNVSSESISCLSCKLGKRHALPFENHEFTSALPFDLIHSDVWGPAPYPSVGGARYFVIFVDDHTQFTWIYLMKHHSELPHIYITFACMIMLCSTKNILSSHFFRLRVVSTYPCPGTSPQNGRAERKHRHILNTVQTLLVTP